MGPLSGGDFLLDPTRGTNMENLTQLIDNERETEGALVSNIGLGFGLSEDILRIEEEAAFKRRDSIIRTPPQEDYSTRTDKRMEVETICSNTEQRNKKRKKLSDSPIQRQTPEVIPNALQTKILNMTAELAKFANENKNVHKEVKKWSREIHSLMKRLVEEYKQDKHIQLEDEEKYKKQAKELADLQSKQEENGRDTREAGTQTEESERPRKEKNWRGQITGEEVRNIHTYEQLVDLSKYTWPDDIGKNVKIRVGNPLHNQENEYSVVLVDTQDREMNKSIQRMYKDRYAELATLNKDFNEIKNTIITNTEEKETRKIKQIIKIVFQDYKQDLYNKLKHLINVLQNREIKTVTMHTVGPDGDMFIKMLRALSHDVDIGIDLYVPRQPGTAGIDEEKFPTLRAKPRDTHAIVVQRGNKNFNQLLGEVKTALNHKENNNIRSIRSTKEGDLVMVLEKDTEKTKATQKILSEAIKENKLRTIGDRTIRHKTLHIRGLDAVTTMTEIADAIQQVIGRENTGEVKLGNIRPGRDNTQTISIIAEEGIARVLIQKKTIQIGLVKCPIEERVDVVQCRRCWSFGHLASKCTEVNRASACFKCGKEGHCVTECQNEEYCPICNKQGHRVGRNNCTAFRKALTRARFNKDYGPKNLTNQP